MRKPTFCICENEGTDQLLSNYEADQPIPYSSVGHIQKPYCWFSHDANSLLKVEFIGINTKQ